MRRHTVSRTLELFVDGNADGPEIVADVTFTFTAGCEPFWDRTLGVMLPGDPDELEVETVTLSRTDEKGAVEDLECPAWLGEWIISNLDQDSLRDAAREESSEHAE